MPLPDKRLRNVGDGADVRRHVLAERAVAARGADRQAPVLVAQIGGQAVDLGLDGEGDRGIGLQIEEAADAGDEIRDILFVEGVAEGQHRHAVAHLGELLRRRAGNRLRRALDGAEFGKLLLDGFEAAAQRVVLRVRDRGHVLLVIAAVMRADLLDEARVLGLRFEGRVGDEICRSWIHVMPQIASGLKGSRVPDACSERSERMAIRNPAQEVRSAIY